MNRRLKRILRIVSVDLGTTRNVVESGSERRLQREGFERRDFPAEAGTLNAVSRKSDVKRSFSAAPAAIEETDTEL